MKSKLLIVLLCFAIDLGHRVNCAHVCSMLSAFFLKVSLGCYSRYSRYNSRYSRYSGYSGYSRYGRYSSNTGHTETGAADR